MNDTYTYVYDAPMADGVDAALWSGIIAFLFFFGLLSYAITAFLLGKVFQKAGVPQWAAWVPVYNTWNLLKMGNQQPFWAILAFIPFVNILSLIFLYIAMYHIGLKLRKEGWFVLVAIFLPIVWMIWLGYDDSKWPKSDKQSASKPLYTKKAAATSHAKKTKKPAKKIS